MDIIFPKPMIFAHRGSSASAPENTLAAFELAVEHGAHAIELDAQLSADGHIMVIHDHQVNRTTNGTGYVNEMDLVALKELDAGSYFDRKYQGEKIPTLSEVLETIGQKILINIELKNDRTPLDDLPRRAAEIVTRHAMQTRVIFSSFNPIALQRVKKELPGTPCGFLTSSELWNAGLRLLGRILIKEYEALHPDARSVTPELISKVHNNGQRIHVYTVNDPEEMRNFFKMGADGIITDKPELAVQILTAMR
jgi:glycerophosphoryl diester phosphodiesterase